MQRHISKIMAFQPEIPYFDEQFIMKEEHYGKS